MREHTCEMKILNATVHIHCDNWIVITRGNNLSLAWREMRGAHENRLGLLIFNDEK